MQLPVADNFVKTIWHDLSRALVLSGKGRSSLGSLRMVLLRATERIAYLAGVRKIPLGERPVLSPAEFAQASQKGIQAAITEAQIALAAGDLRRFIHQVYRAMDLAKALQGRPRNGSNGGNSDGA